MKLHVVYDKNGDILGAVHLGSSPIRVRPTADEHAGHRAADVYVPTEYHHYDLADVCHRLRVDVGAKFPALKTKD